MLARARSEPNTAWPRPAPTGLRVVATRTVSGCAATAGAVSGAGGVAARPAQPASASAEAADRRPRTAARRETAPFGALAESPSDP